MGRWPNSSVVRGASGRWLDGYGKGRKRRADQHRSVHSPPCPGSFSLEAFVTFVPGAPEGSVLCVGPLAAPEAAPCPGTPTSQCLLPHPSRSFPFSTPCLWASLRLGNPSMPGPLKWEPPWACRLPAFKGAQNELQPHEVVSSGRWGAEDGLPEFSLEVRELQESTGASSHARWFSLHRASKSSSMHAAFQPSSQKLYWTRLLKQALGWGFCLHTHP